MGRYLDDAKINNKNWINKSSNYTAVAGDAILADTSTASFTVTLPANPNVNDEISFSDPSGKFELNNLIINRNGKLINGQSTDLVLNKNNYLVTLQYSGSSIGWVIGF